MLVLHTDVNSQATILAAVSSKCSEEARRRAQVVGQAHALEMAIEYDSTCISCPPAQRVRRGGFRRTCASSATTKAHVEAFSKSRSREQHVVPEETRAPM